MEILLLLIALIALIGFAGLLFWPKSSDSGATRPTQATSSTHTQPKRQPFDAQSAEPLPTKPVLQGSAYVVDGDTLVIQKTQIRLFGVDAPELNHPYGNTAKWALVALCKGQT
ncbi:MAG: hypothetical protein Q4P24_18280, partial [Rhodobacterales bacterium]|nr:hypothetical protein [Rhodobacterales bacterium]